MERLGGYPLGEKGTYLFFFRLRKPLTVKTRGGKVFFLKEGYYVYIGSAFGGGGIEKRVGRHLKREKPKRWHLDFVTTSEVFEFLSYVPFYGKRIECNLAGLFENNGELFEPVKGFGCTDCSCKSHLFLIKKPSGSKEEAK